MYKLIYGQDIIGQVEEVPSGSIIVDGTAYRVSDVDNHKKELCLSLEYGVVYAKPYEPPVIFTVMNSSDENDIPERICIDDDYFGDHRAVELNGKIYHVSGAGGGPDGPRIYLSELRPTKAWEHKEETK